MALAQLAGQTVAAAAITDVWEAAGHKFARLLGRGDPKKTEVAERWLAETREQLTAAAGADLEPARAAPGAAVGRAALRICWMRTRASRLTCAPWWRRSRRSCLPGWCPRRIIRSRLGGM